MKRHIRLVVCLPMLAGWLGLAADAVGQNTAAALAAQEEAEDRYRKMAAQLTDLKDNQDLLKSQIEELKKVVRDLSEQITRANNNSSGFATHESLAQLAKQLKDVDEARVKDNKRVIETTDELRRLLQNLAAAPPPPRHTPVPPVAVNPHSDGPAPNDEGFEYLVQKNDTLSGIVQAYRQKNIKVTSKAVMDANPTVKWDRLKVGQKIFIPKPKN